MKTKLNGLKILVVFVFSLIIVTIFIFLRTKNSTFKITTFKKSYSLVSLYQEKEALSIKVYINSKDTYVTNSNKIGNCYIADENKDNVITLTYQNTIDENESILINNEVFYLYRFNFLIPLETTNIFEIEVISAFLYLEYKNDLIKLMIGSFSLYKVPFYGDEYEKLSICMLKPVVNSNNLIAIALGIRNNSLENITIKDVIALDKNLRFSYRDIKQTDEINNIKYNENINELLGYFYDISSIEDYNSRLSYLIKGKSENYFILPIKYLNKVLINKLGLIIKYQDEEKNFEKQYYLDEFLFFDYAFSEKVDYIVYVYENQ